MSNNISFKEYIDAINASAKRVRWCIILLTVVSIIAFSAIWNSSDFGWLNQHIRIIDAGLEWWGWAPDTRAKLSDSEKQIFDRSQRYVEVHEVATQEQLENQRNYAVGEYLSRVPFVEIKALGISYHANDLGMIAGLAFTSIMIMLAYSLRRQRSNLEIVFAIEQEKAESRAAYYLLSMNQVLTLPPEDSKTPAAAWRALPKLLFFLPVAVQMIAIYGFFPSFQYGYTIAPVLTVIVIVVSLFFVGTTLSLAIISWRISVQSDHLWKAQFETLTPASDQDSPDSVQS